MSQMRDPNQIITKRPDGSIDVGTRNDLPSLTQQQFKDECDVNNIVKKYETTGEFTHKTSKTGKYADFSDIKDYQSMLHTVKYAEEAFMELPAKVRYRFSNDPGQLLAFIQNPANDVEARDLGLLNPLPPSVPPVTPTT